ncbi:MAG: ABC transporter ATP-binding protein, partial [Mesorhizobium sp.]
VETGSSEQVFRGPNHPYTSLLLAASSEDQASVVSTLVEAASGPKGCCFADRCPLVEEACRTAEPPIKELGPGHTIACYKL